MIVDFSGLISNQYIKKFLGKGSMLKHSNSMYLLVCYRPLREFKNTIESNISEVVTRCQEDMRKIKDYISTIEKETDPKRAILKCIQAQ